jgi:hypothetical protein
MFVVNVPQIILEEAHLSFFNQNRKYYSTIYHSIFYGFFILLNTRDKWPTHSIRHAGSQRICVKNVRYTHENREELGHFSHAVNSFRKVCAITNQLWVHLTGITLIVRWEVKANTTLLPVHSVITDKNAGHYEVWLRVSGLFTPTVKSLLSYDTGITAHRHQLQNSTHQH